MNKMKKILACALALCMALALVACSGGNNTANNGGESNTPPANSGETNNTAEGGETTETEGNKLIAGIVFQEDQFFKLLSAGYQAAADDLGYEIQMTNTNNDQTRETDALNTYLAQGVAGVAISPPEHPDLSRHHRRCDGRRHEGRHLQQRPGRLPRRCGFLLR